MIRQFEEIRAWGAARDLVNEIYRLTKEKPFVTDFALRDQIRRSAISVMSNIAEGFDSGYRREFIRFLLFSFRSASEVQSQLYIALDQQYVSEPSFQASYDKAGQVKKQINAFITYLKSAGNHSTSKKIGDDTAEYQVFPNPEEFEYEVPEQLFAKETD